MLGLIPHPFPELYSVRIHHCLFRSLHSVDFVHARGHRFLCEQGMPVWRSLSNFKCFRNIICGITVSFCGYNLRIDTVSVRGPLRVHRTVDVQENNGTNIHNLVFSYRNIYFYSLLQAIYPK